MTKIQEQLSLPNDGEYGAVRRELVIAWRDMAELVNNLFTIYYQDSMPTIPVNTTSLWVDTNAGPKYYLVSNFGGTIKKVEMT
jgi:hypothetical protein